MLLMEVQQPHVQLFLVIWRCDCLIYLEVRLPRLYL
jgi:hypothetical protein